MAIRRRWGSVRFLWVRVYDVLVVYVVSCLWCLGVKNGVCSRERLEYLHGLVVSFTFAYDTACFDTYSAFPVAASDSSSTVVRVFCGLLREVRVVARFYRR